MNDKLHELYGKIKDHKDKVEYLAYKIKEIEKPGSRVSVRFELVINNNIRGTSRHNLTKSQVLMILKEEISERALELAELEKQYAAAQ